MATANGPTGNMQLSELCRKYLAEAGEPMMAGIPLVQTILRFEYPVVPAV